MLCSCFFTQLGVFLLAVMRPWMWMTLVAYSMASAQGLSLFLSIFRGGFRREAARMLKMIMVCVVILVLAAFIEAAVLSSA